MKEPTTTHPQPELTSEFTLALDRRHGEEFIHSLLSSFRSLIMLLVCPGN
jgi:hypothetical protein